MKRLFIMLLKKMEQTGPPPNQYTKKRFINSQFFNLKEDRDQTALPHDSDASTSTHSSAVRGAAATSLLGRERLRKASTIASLQSQTDRRHGHRTAATSSGCFE
eukprot:PhM_4_TR16742/c1_g1_i2/m.79334